MAKALFTLSFAGAMLAGLVYAANSALSAPDVYISYSTGECVKVVNYTDENFTCDNYPSKFNHVWAQ
jgi:hypothetical protein